MCVRNDFIPEFDKVDVINLPRSMYIPSNRDQICDSTSVLCYKLLSSGLQASDQGFNLKTSEK